MQPMDPMKIKLVEAALPNVAFDGWSQTTYHAAVAAVGMDRNHAATLCPRGAIDLAVAFHQMGDAAMVAAMNAEDMNTLRYSQKVARAIEIRLDVIADKEAVRRGTTLFALPHMAAQGARLIWGTADQIWAALGDTSDDLNWYTKRVTLAGVYGSAVLYWLGDDTPDCAATNAFIQRRIDDVMSFERVKAQVRDSPLLKPVTGPLSRMASIVKPPAHRPLMDLPGIWRDQG